MYPAGGAINYRAAHPWDPHTTVAIQYVVTFAAREIFEGTIDVGADEALAGCLNQIFEDRYPQVAHENGGHGGALTEITRQFALRADAVKITASNPADEVICALLESPVGQLVACGGYTRIRFHLDTLEYMRHDDYAIRVKRLCAYYNPRMMIVLDRMLHASMGFEDKLLSALVQHYGPEPPRTAVDRGYRQRLVAFYAAYNPGQLGQVDQLLQDYSGVEDQLMVGLIAKYGPEPTAGGPHSPAHGAAAVPASPRAHPSPPVRPSNTIHGRSLNGARRSEPFLVCGAGSRMSQASAGVRSYSGSSSPKGPLGFDTLVRRFGTGAAGGNGIPAARCSTWGGDPRLPAAAAGGSVVGLNSQSLGATMRSALSSGPAGTTYRTADLDASHATLTGTRMRVRAR